MTRIGFTHPLPLLDRSVYSQDAFDEQVGQLVPFHLGEDTMLATLVSARVTPDGTAVDMVLDVTDPETLGPIFYAEQESDHDE